MVDHDTADEILGTIAASPPERCLNDTLSWGEIIVKFIHALHWGGYDTWRHDDEAAFVMADNIGQKHRYNEWGGRDSIILMCIISMLNYGMRKCLLRSLDERYPEVIDDTLDFIEKNLQETGEPDTEPEMPVVRDADRGTQRVFDFAFE